MKPDSAIVYNGTLYLFSVGMADHAHYMNIFDGKQRAGWKAVPGSGTVRRLAQLEAVLNEPSVPGHWAHPTT
jgi:hypothetical protein